MIIERILIALVLVYFATLVGVFAFQRSFLYFPKALLNKSGLEGQDCFMP